MINALDPVRMTAAGRLDEVAYILALDVLRLWVAAARKTL